MDILKSLIKDEDGQGMVEYGIIIALISVVAIVAIKSIGGKTKGAFEQVDKNLTVK